MLRLIKSCGCLATLIVAGAFGGCSPQKAPPAESKPTEVAKDRPPTQPATETALQEPHAGGAMSFHLDAGASTEMDEIIARIGAREEGRMLASTIAVLSEGHARPQRSAKVTGTVGGFSAMGTAGAGKGACKIASYTDAEVKVEANGDGSNAKIVSSLIGTIAKVYGNLTLQASNTVIPKGTVLKRSEQGWKAISDPAAEKRLDEISRGAPSGARAAGFSIK